MSKKIYYIAFFAMVIVGMTGVAGCKKGENDPFLSLKSRKARISGEWKLTSGTLTSSSTNNGISNSSTTVFTETTSTSDGTTDLYTETMTIDKDGTYEVAIVIDGFAYTVRGIWFFAGKIKDLDLKKKEAIVLSGQQYTESGYSATYNGLYGGEVLIIDQLKSKEIIFKGSFSYTNGNDYSSTNTYDRTFTKK
jgi:hypothetical protein